MDKVLLHAARRTCRIAADASVLEALQCMDQNEVDALLVMDGARLAGVFSEHDFARGVLHHPDGTLAPVGTMMADVKIHVTPDETVDRCLALMAENGLHHLPVLRDGEAIALLSREDLLGETVDHHVQVFQAAELDHRIMFLRGTYSC